MGQKQLKFKNRRTDARMELGPWSYSISLINTQKKEFQVLLDNISLGGAGIISEVEFLENSEVWFSLDKNSSHYFNGFIKWKEKLPNNKFKFGVQFEIGNEKELDLIKETVTHIFLSMPKEFVILKAIELFTSGQVLNTKLKDTEKENILMREDFQKFVKQFQSSLEGSIKDLPGGNEQIIEYLYRIYLLQNELASWSAKVDQNYH